MISRRYRFLTEETEINKYFLKYRIFIYINKELKRI